MTFRWYGEGNDSITPEMIKQIPGVSGLVWALHDKMPGEVWEVEEIAKAKLRKGSVHTWPISEWTDDPFFETKQVIFIER